MFKKGIVFLSFLILLLSIAIVVILKLLNVNTLSNVFLGCKDPQGFGSDGLKFHACPMDNIELAYIYTDAQEYYSRGAEFGIILREDPVVFDVGANIGLVSHVFATKLPKSKIYAFEPSPVTYDQLTKNVKEHEHEDIIVPIFIALSNEESDPVDFIHYPNVPPLSGFKKYEIEITDEYIESLVKIFFNKCQSSEIFPSLWFLFQWPVVKDASYYIMYYFYYYSNVLFGYGETEEFKVPVTTLSNIVRDYDIDRIDLIVIDTEGAEWDILNGLEKKDWAIVENVILEVHRNVEFDYDHYKGAKIIIKFLEERGFSNIHIFDEAKEINEREGGDFEFDLILYASRTSL